MRHTKIILKKPTGNFNLEIAMNDGCFAMMQAGNGLTDIREDSKHLHLEESQTLLLAFSQHLRNGAFMQT